MNSGECAEHFRTVIDKYPPQVSSRSAAAIWGCVVHNEVNKSLNKEMFDCAKIGDFYDCGCAEEDESLGANVKTTATTGKSPVGRSSARIEDAEGEGEDVPLTLEQEG